jgi:hypothetical protein
MLPALTQHGGGKLQFFSKGIPQLHSRGVLPPVYAFLLDLVLLHDIAFDIVIVFDIFSQEFLISKYGLSELSKPRALKEHGYRRNVVAEGKEFLEGPKLHAEPHDNFCKFFC